MITAAFLALLLAQAGWSLPSSSSFITNGEDAAAGQLPHQASIVVWRPLIGEQLKCGGSILNERWILTSGLCDGLTATLPLGRVRVKVGQQKLDDDGENVQVRDVSLVIINQDLRPGIPGLLKESDIALVKLSKPLSLNKRVQPVKLPAQDEIPEGKAVISGLGLADGLILPEEPEVLQWAKVSIISEGDCADAIATTSTINKNRLTDKQICTGPLDKRITTCLGDSGDPLVQQKDNATVQIGIASWSICNRRGAPIVYTRVSAFVDWITKRITENADD